MKNTLFVLALVAVVLLSFSLCFAEDGFSKENPITLKIGASPVPHAEILAAAKDLLAERGINLEIIEFTDYVLPNLALQDGSIDANYFQHKPYLDSFNADYGSKDSKWVELIGLTPIHFEPMALYAGKTKSLADLKDGAKIAVPSDTTNEARALLLLEANGLIKLREGAGLKATKIDIIENPKKLNIIELEAAQIPRSLADVDAGVINGNYALQSGLTKADVIAIEGADSEASTLYGNFIAVKSGNEELPQNKVLNEVLTSDAIRDFIIKTYGDGAAVPAF